MSRHATAKAPEKPALWPGLQRVLMHRTLGKVAVLFTLGAKEPNLRQLLGFSTVLKHLTLVQISVRISQESRSMQGLVPRVGL